MKQISKRSFIISICLLLGSVVIAQDTVTVDQGLGTLETAISENGGDVVYKLTAGEWYGLQSIIEVSDSTMGDGLGLTIVGEETDGMPPIIQVGVDGAGSAFPLLFQAFNDLTLKNLFLSVQDFSGVTGPGVIGLNNAIKVVIDNCVIDPSGINYTFAGGDPADGSKLFLTNTQILNNGHMQGPNDGGWLQGMQWDTLWIENNTFVSSGQDFIGTPFHNVPNNNFIWINHNTFLWHDVWIKKSYNDQNFYFTNNLMQDISIFSQLYAWGQFFPDYKQGNTMLSLLCIDTLETDPSAGGGYETLPSQRNMFWEYNLQWNTPQLLSIPQHGADSGFTPVYCIPMLWDDDVPLSYTAGVEVVSPADSSRENRILADKVNWPNMKYNNNWYDALGDPAWENPMIEQINDSMKMNIQSWWGAVIWGEAGAVFDGTPSYNYEVDKWAGTPNEEFPLVWPRFNGKYANAAMKTASIEGLPLGDLNWFPGEMAKWMAEKDQIEAHILALNEGKYQLTGIQDVYTSAKFSIFPNPANDMLNIASDSELSSAKVYDVTGKMIEQINLNGDLSRVIDISNLKKGVYLLEVETVSGESFTSKILKN